MAPDNRPPDERGSTEQTETTSGVVATRVSANSQPARKTDHHTHTDVHVHGLYAFGLGYGRIVHKLRWLILALWVAALAVAVPGFMQVSSKLSGGGYTAGNSESVHVTNILKDKFQTPANTLIAVFQSSGTPTTDLNYKFEVEDFMARASAYPNVTSVTESGAGKDNKTLYVTINLNDKAPDSQTLTSDIQSLLPQGADATPAKAYLTGAPALDAAFSDVTQQDVEHSELYGLPIALIALLIIFGSVVAAFLPILLAGFAVPIALGVIFLIASHFDTSVFVLNIASIVGLGVSIDYSLFMTRRFREELARGRTVPEAVGWTVATAGEAILFSGLTVMIGFAGLLLIGMQMMTSFGIGGMVVVAVAALAALTLLPALLAILGPRVNALRVPFLWKMVGVGAARADAQNAADDNTTTTRGFWARLAEGVMRRPIVTILGVVVLLLGLGWPVLSLNIGTMSTSALPASLPARQGLIILDKQFPELSGDPIIVVAQTTDGSKILSSDNLVSVQQLSLWIAQQSHVTGVTSVTKFDNAPSLTELQMLYSTGAYKQTPGLTQLVNSTVSGDTTIITVTTDAKTESAAAKNLVQQLRAGGNNNAGGLKVYVGGYQATSLDFNNYLYGNFPRAVLLILAATFVLLLIMFRSLLLPLKAVIMNTLAISATFGALVFIFQWGYGHNLLQFTTDGYIDSLIPILMFCALFGLSMDYEVFLLSRIREEWERTKNNRVAVARGLEHTGGVITNAALLFIIVTGAFTFTRTVMTKEIGLGMTIAVLVDATIIRTLLVPATMRLLGRWNWWLPGRPIPPKQVNEA